MRKTFGGHLFNARGWLSRDFRSLPDLIGFQFHDFEISKATKGHRRLSNFIKS